MPEILVDLYSDTVTKPSPAMRQAMAEAEVGDEQKLEDPTTNRLQEMVAALLGQEAAVFLPSGTMCNEIALAVHCEAGDEVVIDGTAHAITAEAGGPAVVARALLRPVNGERGVYTAAQLEAAIRVPLRQAPVSRLAWVEQTSNFGGGTCWTLEQVTAVCDLAHERGLRTHCDGARVMNAVVATGTPAAEFGRHFDSIWLDLSKGLGAPVGGVLAGTADFIERAWKWKQRLGGAMRQSGIIAAAGVYALEHNVERLAEDHDNARPRRGPGPAPRGGSGPGAGGDQHRLLRCRGHRDRRPGRGRPGAGGARRPGRQRWPHPHPRSHPPGHIPRGGGPGAGGAAVSGGESGTMSAHSADSPTS